LARRLALIVQNALVNGDVQRAQTALRNLHHSTNGESRANPNRPQGHAGARMRAGPYDMAK